VRAADLIHHFGRTRFKRRDNNKMGSKELWCENMDWISKAENLVQ
jgi:hypothetical protein